MVSRGLVEQMEKRRKTVHPLRRLGLVPATKNKAFLTAFWNGVTSGVDDTGTNPYGDHRTDYGNVTWAKAFWRQWQHGRAVGRQHRRAIKKWLGSK